jgi:hypothetical protein
MTIVFESACHHTTWEVSDIIFPVTQAQVTPGIDWQETWRPWELAPTITAVLERAPRSGKPCGFTPEQGAQIIP